ncbi:MAG: hypothetical protein KJ915_13710 [Candidatus Omnitrophica bacterium]|nr:hypothetical protein [Candidatus Omnitrophota bacterium]
MFNNFTRRHLLDVPEYDLKYEYIPPSFRFDLYKIIISDCESTVQEYCLFRDSAVSINKDIVRFRTVEEMEEYYNPDLFVEMLLDVDWHQILSLIEFYIHKGLLEPAKANKLFLYHKVGYRYKFEKGHSRELGEIVVHYESLIEEADRIVEADIKYEGVIASIKEAKKALIDPEKINLAHSIKYSIDALEGFLKGWLNERKLKVSKLGDAIKQLQKGKLCPEHIVKALEQFYIFRNRTDNVGHGSPEVAPISKEDALLCLEMSTSFINYFYKKKVTNTFS